jgi:O-antigen ligase
MPAPERVMLPSPSVSRLSAAPVPVPFAIPLLYIYFIGLCIRPQDWFGPMIGLPMDIGVFGLIVLCLPLYAAFIPRILKGHLGKLMFLWLFVIVASNLVTGETWYARRALDYYSRLVFVFFSLLICLTSSVQVRRIIWFVVILITLLALQSIDQVHSGGIGWAGQGLAWNDGYGGRARWVGLWDGPNVLCLLFVIAFPFLLEFIWGPWAILTRAFALVCAGVIFQGILFTQSRGGFLALAVSVLIACMLRFRLGRAAPWVGAFAIMLVVAAPGRMGNMDDRDGSKSAYNRVEVWSAGLQMLKADPLLGVGKTRYVEYTKQLAGKRLIAHNSYVENMGETGLIGLFVYIALSYVVVKGLWQLRTRLQPREQSMSRALLTSVCGYALTSMFVTTDFDLFYVQLGLAGAFLASHDALPQLGKRDLLFISFSMIAFVIALYGFIQVYL